ncbi:MAG: Membrane protein insertase YidC [Chlamydiae bacterium]|nr:Membrane protein insertase YidC [Chlamydiota bacterium]
MDKRTLLFVISLSLTLFLVNMFFEQRKEGMDKGWHEQQKAIKEQEREGIQVEIKERTAKLKDLPVVSLYVDSGSTNFLTSGIRKENSIITLAWDKDLPKSIFVEGREYTLVYSPKEINYPVLYELQTENTLPIGNLPYMGSYELQLVTFYPSQAEKTPLVTFGKYIDGQFTIPIVKWLKLSAELGIEEAPKEVILPGNSLVLLSTPEGYLPVAYYNEQTNSFSYLEQISGLRAEVSKPRKITTDQVTEEKHFVLENNYQQLVFSNRGAALAEINLPFESESHPNSVVKEIEFDREIEEDHPYNALFPLHSYWTPGNSPKGPFVENPKGKLGGYYPLLRRDLLQLGNRKSTHILPQFYALNLVSEYPEMAELMFEVTRFDDNTIVFEASQRNRRITKTYSFKKENKEAPYCLYLTIRIEGDSQGLWLTSGVSEVEWISNATAPALKYRITRKGKPEVINIDKPKESVTISSIYPDWITNSNGFFGLIIDPLTEIDPGLRAQYVDGAVVPSRLIQIDEEYERYKSENLPGYMMTLPLLSKGGTMDFRIYAGPFASKTLNTVDSIFTDPATGYNPDYIGSQTFHGYFAFISAPFSKFLLILMQFFYFLTGSWGISIILLTAALRVMLYPLNAWSTKSMLKMQQITPETQKIQAKYKNDKKKAQLEIMNLYRDRGVNPVSGCFPLLIQMPFLIGMFDLLKSTFELRGASFIPGWIDNLAAPDVLFSWSKPIPFIGTQFHLLPILLGGVMFVQQKLMSTLPKDPSQLTDQQRQQKMMGTMMTVVFAVMFYHFPSGLNIYWLSSMLLGILQQWWTQKRFKTQAATVQLQTEPVTKRGKRSRRR